MPLRQITVSVSSFSGENVFFQFDAYLGPRISDLREEIAKKWRIPCLGQKLVQDDGMVVHDNSTALQDGSHLQFVHSYDILAIVQFILELPCVRAITIQAVFEEGLSHLTRESSLTDVVIAVVATCSQHHLGLRAAAVEVSMELAQGSSLTEAVTSVAANSTQHHLAKLRAAMVEVLTQLGHRDQTDNIGGTEAIASIRPYLDDEDIDVRFLAALGLSECVDKGADDAMLALAVLKRCCSHDGDPDWHKAALEGVAKHSDRGDHDNIIFVSAHLSDDNWQVRLAAVRAIGCIGKRGDPAVIAPLVKLLKDEWTVVLLAVAEALKKLAHHGDESVIGSLSALVLSDDSEIQKAAQDALNVLV